MASVELQSVIKRFGAVEVIRGIDLKVPDGSFTALLGASGSGKSTLLRMIAGLEETTGGNIRIGDRDVTNLPAAQRGAAMVFQSYALYPHLTVEKNIAFSLSLAGAPKADQRVAVDRVAKLLQIEDLRDRRPAQLSGGQRQRVAIGRALVRDPKVFLFDEPLSNLDALLRVQMRLELAKLHQDLGTTMIYVTHDQVEAMTLADQIVVLDQGVIQQVGSPLELYNAPANRFVAGFVGSPAMNFVPVQHRDGKLSLPEGAEIDAGGIAPAVQSIGIRPEHVHLAADFAHFNGVVTLIERLGNLSYVHLQTPAGAMIAEAAAGISMAPGDRVGIGFEAGHMLAFDVAGRALNRP